MAKLLTVFPSSGKSEKVVLRLSFLLSCAILVTFGFTVAPMGLSGTYLPFGNYAKAGKSGNGVSWSKNLDLELQLRRTLCQTIPESLLYQYRYDNTTKACHKVGDKGPCGQNMVFFGYQTNAVYGHCDCNYNDNGRALILDPSMNMCHFVFSKGYCKENEWLTFTKEWEPTCEPNKCLFYYEEHVNKIIPDERKTQKSVAIEFIPYNDKCVALGVSCEDKNKGTQKQWNSLSYLPHEIQFIKGKLNAKCVPTKYIAWRYPTPKLQCLPGGFLAQTTSENCNLLFEV